jgi:hypothetical protein
MTAWPTSTTPATPSRPPSPTSAPTVPPPTSPPRCSPTTTATPTSATSWAGPPATAAPSPPTRPGRPARPSASAPPGRRRGEDLGLRRGPARQALPVGHHRPCRLRLLWPHHAGLPRRRDRHPPHHLGAVGRRAPHPRRRGPARRPRVLRWLRRHPHRPRPRRHRHQPRHDDRRPVHRAGRPGGKLRRQPRPGRLHPPLSSRQPGQLPASVTPPG